MWVGVAVTVVVWILLAAAYSYYLAHFATFASTYAGLAGIIAALYFIYMLAIIFIFGGEINRVIRLRRKAREGSLGSPPKGRKKGAIATT